MAVKPTKRYRRRVSNWELMNAIRNDATDTYRQRVPAATQADQKRTIDALDKYTPARNEFKDALVNMIGLVKFAYDSHFENPLGKYKQGKLDNGDTIEEVGIGLLEAYAFDFREDVGERELFGQHDIEVQSSFHRINRQEKYIVTIQEAALQRAFTSDYGISEMVARIMQAPTKSNEVDEYVQMANLIREADERDAFYRIHTPDVAADESTEADAKGALRVLRTIAGNIGFVSRKYNAAHLPVSATPEQLELIITPEASAALDVNGLAALFNIERGQVPYHQTLVEKEYFPEGVWAILTTRDFWQVYDVLLRTTSQENAGGLYTNYWLHIHQVMSFSRFVPLIALTDGPGTEETRIEEPITGVTALEIYDTDGVLVEAGTELQRGRYYRVYAQGTTAVDVPEIHKAVTYSQTGLTDQMSMLDQRGTFLASPHEKADTINLTATSVADDTKSATRIVQLSGDIISAWNPIAIIEDPSA